MIDKWSKLVERKLGELNTVRRGLLQENKARTELDTQLIALWQAQQLTQAVAQRVQSQAHARISHIVTRCLEAVFDKPYTFHIVFERKRARTEARLVFERDGEELDPLSESGGGVVNVAAFALRVACLLLSKPALRRVLILDEPFHFLSADLHTRVRSLIETLAQEMKLQVIMITHETALRAGKVIELSPD